MAKDLTAVRIESELIEALRRISQENDGIYYDRSVNWLIGRAVEEFVERNQGKKSKEPKSSRKSE